MQLALEDDKEKLEAFTLVEQHGQSDTFFAEGEVLGMLCHECGSEAIRRYPVLTASEGWFVSTKCLTCLATLSREPWYRLGWVRLPEDEEYAI